MKFSAALLVVCAVGVYCATADVCLSADLPAAISAALDKAGKNREQLELAWKQTPNEQREGLEFLLVNMPDRDLQNLSADFLREHLEFAYKAYDQSPWKASVSKELFLNDILPYASINEHREKWRADLHARCLPIVVGIDSPGKAAVMLNQKIFDAFKVHYSTKRAKADQSPSESMASGLASCSGLSVLLIDSCRSVGIPARFVGTPMWADESGNHSWVEVWDQGWHFTGAQEPSGDKLDKGWFAERAATAKRDDRMHAIYASSFKRTPALFPFVWAPEREWSYGVNVTDRYAQKLVAIPEGQMRVMFRVLDRSGGDRLTAKISVKNAAGEIVFSGQTNDERFDANDHLSAVLKMADTYTVAAQADQRAASATFSGESSGKVVTLVLASVPSAGQAGRSRAP